MQKSARSRQISAAISYYNIFASQIHDKIELHIKIHQMGVLYKKIHMSQTDIKRKDRYEGKEK